MANNRSSPTRASATRPRRASLRLGDAADAGGRDLVRDLILEVRSLHEKVDRLGKEIEKIWARERTHARTVAAVVRVPRKAGSPSGRPAGGRATARPGGSKRSSTAAKGAPKGATPKGGKRAPATKGRAAPTKRR